MPSQTIDKDHDFRKTIESIARTKSSPVSVFADFVKISACVVACQSREDEYLATISNYSQDEMQAISRAFAYLVNEMQSKPFSDVLGSYYETINSKSARSNRGEFFTPEPISELMARISFNVEQIIADNKPITINEPTCGSGGMILQIAKQFSPERTGREKSYIDLLRVTAQDLSPIACDMTYVNTTLWGIPTQILQGNSLSMEIEQGWNNIHWLRVGEDKRQQFLALKRLLEGNSKTEKSSHTEQESSAFDFTVGEQMSLEL